MNHDRPKLPEEAIRDFSNNWNSGAGTVNLRRL